MNTCRYTIPRSKTLYSSICVISLLLISALILFMAWSSGYASQTNGFDTDGALIPSNEIFHGGPPRDGIPSIDKPRFLSASNASFLKPDDRVLGVFHNNVAKAYPIRILNYHEIVNDKMGKDAIVVSFCPLCGTGMVFKSSIKGIDRSFGVSGLLYNSDMLLYDRESFSLWSQIMMQSISGPLKGTQLDPLAVSNTSWSDWRDKYPTTKVLSRNTGFSRNYDSSPYPGYLKSESVMFPVSNFVAKYHPKELVIGLQIGKSFKAYPFSELGKADKKVLNDTLGGVRLSVLYSAKHRTGSVYNENNEEIPTVISFWFAWAAFHPNSEVYLANGPKESNGDPK
jgi:hypothetical protein